MPRLRLVLAACLLAALCTAPAHGKTRVAIALGEQSPAMFTNPHFQKLKVKKVRYFIRWDAAKPANRYAIEQTDAYVAEARRTGARVLIHISTNDYTHRRARLPKPREYRKWVGKLVRRYKAQGVREWGTWNEANHISQPTWDNPRRAAQYFRLMRKMCRGCTIVALDLLDQRGSDKYAKRFYRALKRSERRYARIVGIHNYADVNRKRMSGTKTILRAVRRQNRRAQFWVTETGGLVLLGRSFPCSERRAANRLKYLFRVTKRYRRQVKRVYLYNFFAENPPCTRFDAGLIRPDGTPRPGYRVVKRLARQYIR